MPSPQPQQQGSFSLFPSPNSRAVTPTPTPQELRVGNTPNHDNAQVQQARTAQQIQKPPSEVPGQRTEATSRSSVAKQPLGDDTAGTLRSIFPAYNPDVPLGQQDYAPTQLGPGPARIPRAVISRQSVHEEQQPESPSPSREPATAARGRWPPRIQTRPTPRPPPPPIPPPCSTADLKSLWRVANGWKASASEGRVFCLRLAQQRDAPVYTLSSGTSQPLWNLRLDPTSASSAYVNLTRHDPSKPPPSSSSPSSSSTTDTKNWHEALTTTLEEESRRHPPHDGLVALLTPSAAARMAAERAGDAASVAAADNERARLVWDEDTSTHYLVHNALARPFCLTIERSPAYSRTEYTLEHDESPRHIARLTKDGTGGGWVELDTGVASQIASCYVLDVVVASLLLVAAAEDRNSPAPMETFEPPPPAFLAEPSRASGRLGRLSVGRRDDRKKGKKQRSMEEFEIDVESQNDSLGKGRRENRSPEDKLPLLVRAVVKLVEALFSLVIWILTVLFMCVGGVFKVLYKCVGSKY